MVNPSNLKTIMGEATQKINPLTGEDYIPDHRRTIIGGVEFLTYQLALCEMDALYGPKGFCSNCYGQSYDAQSALVKQLVVEYKTSPIPVSAINLPNVLDVALKKLE